MLVGTRGGLPRYPVCAGLWQLWSISCVCGAAVGPYGSKAFKWDVLLDRVLQGQVGTGVGRVRYQGIVPRPAQRQGDSTCGLVRRVWFGLCAPRGRSGTCCRTHRAPGF